MPGNLLLGVCVALGCTNTAVLYLGLGAAEQAAWCASGQTWACSWVSRLGPEGDPRPGRPGAEEGPDAAVRRTNWVAQPGGDQNMVLGGGLAAVQTC